MQDAVYPEFSVFLVVWRGIEESVSSEMSLLCVGLLLQTLNGHGNGGNVVKVRNGSGGGVYRGTPKAIGTRKCTCTVRSSTCLFFFFLFLKK